MRIQHNIMAINAYRNYNTNTSALSKNLEKLSSGYKINRAGDDAAGLAISEKMRAQITGLNAAQKNVKDGISLVKTAEGAMQEIQDMLNRMDYLATQSANGTYQDEVDRENLNKEVTALKTEINRIADSANFNGIKLLDGSLASNGTTTSSPSTGNMVATVESSIASLKTNQDGDSATAGKYEVTVSAAMGTAASVASTDAIKFTIDYTDADGVKRSKTLYTETSVANNGAGAKDVAAAIKDAIDADSDLSKLFSTATGTTPNEHKLTLTAKQAGTNGAQLNGLSIAGTVDAKALMDPNEDTAIKAEFTSGGGVQKVEVTEAAKDKTTVDVIDFGTTASDLTAANLAGKTIKIGDKTYEFVDTNKDSFAVGKGHIAVNGGSDAAESLKNLTEALKANGVTSAVANVDATGTPPVFQIRIGDLDQIKAADNKVAISTNNKTGIVIAGTTADKAQAQFTTDKGSGGKATFDITYIDENGETKKASLSYTSDTTSAAANAGKIKEAFDKHENLSSLFKFEVDTNGVVSITAKNAGANQGSVVSVSTTDTNPDSVRGLRQVTAGRDAGQSIALDTNQMAYGDTLTIGGKTFEFVDKDNLDSVKQGNIAVILDKTSQAVTAANLNLAMKQNGMDVEFNASTNSFFVPDGGGSSTASGGLTLQIGDTADKFNQMNVSIGDMHVSAMGTGKTTLDGKTVNVTKTIADVDIGSLEGAQEAIAVVKNAINYVSGIRGDLGAIQNRLEHTQKNLSVMAENIQDAESNIRDTDVAEEMMAYTKNNILVQSAQAMLAQANQVPQGVLQLLG